MRYDPMQTAPSTLSFEPGKDCTAAPVASHGSILVDCANYYRDLHESLCKARHSIFILGWDIDSRIHLIRKEEDKVNNAPVTLYELLTKKARENPDLQIYLNKWNYAFFMASAREPLSIVRWRKSGLPNIHYCHDGRVPSGACHHQKIVVVDDEVAFCGGMDVAIARWDTRDHIPEDPHRVDPGGVFKPHSKKKFKPYHDIQTVVGGEAAQEFAKIARERWYRAAGYEAIPLREIRIMDGRDIYPAWPDTDPPDFKDIDTAIVRTLPEHGDQKERFEIETTYLKEIGAAEHFIYMENQYFTSLKLASALNKRMQEVPDLRVLLVSSYDPQGFIEKVCMWSGRMRFRKKIEENGCADRVCMAYPASRRRTEDGYQSVRIHSKIMATDDKYLSIGSANLNNRSMRLDTECDIVYRARTDAHRHKIADVRNDLIHEHSGLEKEQVAEMVAAKVNPCAYTGVEGKNKQLVKINDMEFFAHFPAFIARALGDPEKGLLPELLPLPSSQNSYLEYFSKRNILLVLGLCLFVAVAAIFWKNGIIQEFGSKENLLTMFENVENSRYGVVGAIVVYALCALFFLPVTVLTGVTAIIFGYWYGLLISMTGALLSGAAGFMVGRGFENVFHKLLSGPILERVKQHAENSNVVGITFLRMLPVAPFSAVNIALGMLKVPFFVFITATFFGMLPGKLAAVFLADSIGDLWKHPDVTHILYAVAGFVAWFGVVWLTHYLYKHWQKSNRPQES